MSAELVNTYLLRVLTTLFAERSVSRTAIRLNQSQPAISAALKRLRDTFDDPLLVRDKTGLVPTARGAAVHAHARAALAAIDHMLGSEETFDPASTRHAFRVGCPDYMAPAFLAAVIGAAQRDAPHARVTVSSLGPAYDFERALADDKLDVVIGNWPQPPEGLHLAALMEDEIVCLVRRGHPLASGMTADDYARARHVVPLPYSAAQRGAIDTRLAQMRITREACVSVQSFNLAPYMLVDTDLVFTITAHFARFYADALPLAVVRPPIEFPPMRFYQLWHERTHRSAAHRWLRARVGDAAAGLRATAPATPKGPRARS